jgi:hypothetical protein
MIYINYILYCYMRPKVGLAQKKIRKQDPGYGNEIPERNIKKNQKRQNQKQWH